MSLVDFLVEGDLDGVVAKRLLLTVGLTPGQQYGRRGWTYIQQKINDFARARQPLFALVDLMDTRLKCPGLVVSTWLHEKYEQLIFRVVCQEIESWLLADREAMAEFLNIPAVKIPLQTDTIADPKCALVNWARQSKSRKIRDGIPPALGLSSSEGTQYAAYMAHYAQHIWQPQRAVESSQSLARCIKRLHQFAGKQKN